LVLQILTLAYREGMAVELKSEMGDAGILATVRRPQVELAVVLRGG
jgi:hypothetical protein